MVLASEALQQGYRRSAIPQQKTAEAMANAKIGHTVRIALGRLPQADAPLKVLITFCEANNPILEFKERWASEYFQRAQDLWTRSTHAFREGRPVDVNADELLLCMVYHTTVAPYIGVPEDVSHRYLHAMLRALREKRKEIDE